MCVPGDFLEKAACAIHHLQKSGCSNVLYALAHGLGTIRPGSHATRFPTDRMPMGLLEYMANFFAATDMSRVGYMSIL